MREPQDIFIKEFLMHPGWADVIEKIEHLVLELKESMYRGDKDKFDNLKGRIEGVYETLSLIRGLIRKAKG